MPPKRKAAPSSATSGSSAKKPAPKSKRAPSRRPAPKLAAQLDMYIRRSDDEESDDEPIPPILASSSKPSRAANGDVEYEPESDEASQIASSDEDQDEEQPEVKTVSAANLAFLSGLDKNKAIDVSHKDAKQKAKDLKRSDRKEFDETRKRIAAEKKAKLTQPDSDEEDSFEDQDFSDEDMEDMEDDEVMPGEKKNYEEYSDVSEGEEVGASSSDEEEVAAPVKGKKKKQGEDEDTEAAYLARLGKRKAREQYQEEEERKKRANAKLPVRKLDGDLSASEGPDSSDEDAAEEEDGEEYRRESEPEGLVFSDDDETPASKAKSRAVHAPLPATAASGSDSDSTKPSVPSRPTAPHSSITHSSRFNLTAPYEILLTSHSSRLPPAPSPTAPRKAHLNYQKTLLFAQSHTLTLARNQLASLSSQIIADPEVNLGLLRRLAVFAAPTISAPPEKIPEIRVEAASLKAEGKAHLARPVKVEVLPSIRQLAMLSMLAVFIDILPGYRIRSLTEKEQEEKVGQEVARRREFESGLVSVYRDFLELCEDELKAANASSTPVKGKKPAPGVD
ncbi:hypothetical protein NDA16_003415 [Ustilago loliicola]|nr:hypothetical protein NDA16_003415 [Ustilago loliicola]